VPVSIPRSKIAIIGAGAVGSTYAFALSLRGLAREILIIDIDRKRAEGEAIDMSHGLPLLPPCDISASDRTDGVADADLIVIAAGVGQKIGETRLELVGRNLKVFQSIFNSMPALSPNTLILVVSNPVDVLTYASLKYSGLPPERVIGSGTSLDTHRFRNAIAEHFNLDSRNVHGYVVGEHGDSEVPLWSSVHIGSLPLQDFCHQFGGDFDKNTIFEQQVRQAAYRIIERKGWTNYGIAVALVSLTEAILRDQNTVLCVSSYLREYSGIHDVCLSVPCVVNRQGIRQWLKPPMYEQEYEAFAQSASIIGNTLDSLHLRK